MTLNIEFVFAVTLMPVLPLTWLQPLVSTLEHLPARMPKQPERQLSNTREPKYPAFQRFLSNKRLGIGCAFHLELF